MRNDMTEERDLRTCRVLATPTTFGSRDPDLRDTLEHRVAEVRYNPDRRPLTAAELEGLIKGVDGFIAGLDDIDASVIAAADRLKVIARYGVGVDRVDLAAATARGIVVTNTPGANAAAVAELAVAMMLALARQLCRADQEIRRGQWPRVGGIGLRGRTVGLLGFGAIGRETARRLRGFGCRLLACDPHVSRASLAGWEDVELVPLDEFLAAADIVSLHPSLNPATAGMIDAVFLKRLKPGALLVNTARGELIDETALEDALSTGRLRGAALDCFNREPLPPDHPLLLRSDVILTPHMGAHTDEAVNTMGRMAMEACLAVLRGQRPAHVVNPEVYER
jgi:D-3-phosphoglycerate dehydrogenase